MIQGGGTANRQEGRLLPPLLQRDNAGTTHQGQPARWAGGQRRTPRQSRGSVAAIERPRRGPSRPRYAGKLQDRLRAWHAEDGHGPAASYFAMRGTVDCGPAASLTSALGQDSCDTLSGWSEMSRCRRSCQKRRGLERTIMVQLAANKGRFPIDRGL